MTLKRKLFEFDNNNCRRPTTYNTFAYSKTSFSLLTSTQQSTSTSRENFLPWIVKDLFISNELKWKTRTFVILTIGIFLIFIILQGESKLENYNDITVPAIEIWDRNHFQGDTRTERSMLIVQFYDLSTISWLHLSSKPNRAYARHWRMDYLPVPDLDCPAQFVSDVYSQQQQLSEDDPVYDAILILPANAILTDMDYDVLGLLPTDHAATVTTNGEMLRMFNLRHDELPTILKVWSTCEVSLQEATETIRLNSILRINPSIDGFVEPRRIRFVKNPTLLQTTVDNVCYRYYPRCDVL
jgi:hypothetical protein